VAMTGRSAADAADVLTSASVAAAISVFMIVPRSSVSPRRMLGGVQGRMELAKFHPICCASSNCKIIISVPVFTYLMAGRLKPND
jgi:hypothetical protein